jgi:hypothetical protein
MPVKDRVVTWFIQHVIMPRREIIDKPGFIVTNFTEHNQTTYLRELLLSEQLFELIESEIVQKYGEQGKQVLYSTGKKFGYLYASLSNFPTITTCSEKEVSDFAYYLIRYIETVYAHQANHEIDISDKTLAISFSDYIICRHNGLGYIMTEGGITGIWAYLMQDKSIEGIQSECQGRGNQRCFITCAPKQKIQENGKKIYCETNLPENKFDQIYKTMNEIRETKSVNSLKKLLDNRFFEYNEGILTFKNNRFFICESHILYLLEQEISKLENGEQILFDICFEYGKILREIYGEKEYQKFIIDFFPALGFGDITFLDSNSIAAVYYPWTIHSETTKYIIFRGIMSGIASDSTDEKIEFRNYDVSIRDNLTLTITS